jgi:hypothetical protein
MAASNDELIVICIIYQNRSEVVSYFINDDYHCYEHIFVSMEKLLSLFLHS